MKNSLIQKIRQAPTGTIGTKREQFLEGYDRVRLLLIMFLCNEKGNNKEYKELINLFHTAYPTISLNSLQYILNTKVI